MTIVLEILEELRRGTTLIDVKKKYRSESQIYAAFREFRLEADKILLERRENLRKMNERLRLLAMSLSSSPQDNCRAHSKYRHLFSNRFFVMVEIIKSC